MGTLSGKDEDDQDTTTQQDQQHVDDPNDDTDGTAVDKQDPSVPTVIEDDAEPQEDARLSDDQEDDQEQDEDGEPRRRRETAKERRERAKAARARDKQDLQLLRDTVAKQNTVLEDMQKRQIVMQITDIDNRLATESQTATQMDEVFAAAITAKNGKDAAAAASLRDDAKQKAWQLYHQKEALVKQLNAPRTQEVSFKGQAMEFLSDKPWYNPASGDEDSLIVEAMDKALSKKMNPNDPNYWATLDQKVRERLPHKFQDTESDDQDDEDAEDDPPPPRQQQRQQQAAAPRRKGPPTGGSSRSQSGSRPNEIRLPPEMVQTMKEAGYWDDPKTRARVAQRYIDGVKKNKSNG